MKRGAFLAVLVASLGYFVDIYDLILFLVVRVKSLRGIGVPESELLDRGVLLLNLQMIGMLSGGVLWGILGDKRGRLSVLFGSIFLYSVANVLNGFVRTVPEYAVLRFTAGLGLAGELGAGVTLASEILEAETRGFGTTIIAGVGVCGAIVAALVARAFSWQVAYFVGGGLGLGLLALRVSVSESGMFESVRTRAARRGDLALLFAKGERVRRYLAVVLVGVPIWYAVGILVGLSPELCAALGLAAKPDPGRSVMAFYAGATLGDFGSGVLSQLLRSRKKVIGLFLGLTALSSAGYFAFAGRSLSSLYLCAAALGAATGYWAVFVTVAAEHFGTNLRATATTTAPNVVRGAVVPMTAAFQALRGSVGVVTAAIAVGVGAFALAAVALGSLEETYGRNLDYLED
ncbi:MAG TPA: MFS transporter [Polyangiaceae bacterium]|nr:MFS transporter [Polyangiaceae bacterium]